MRQAFCKCQNRRSTSKYEFLVEFGFDIRLAHSWTSGGANVKSTPLASVSVPAAQMRPRRAAFPPIEEGAGNAGCAARTHGPVYKIKSTRASVTTGRAVQPAFPARWCYGFLRALPGDRAFCHRPQYNANEVTALM